MRPVGELRRAAAAAAAAAIAALFAGARPADAQLYWDINGPNPGATDTNSATGTWTDASWTIDASGLAATGAFVPSSAVVFSAGTNASGTSTITVPSSQTTGGFTVEEGTVILTGATTAIVNGANPVRINPGAVLSIPNVSAFSTTAGSVVTLDGGTLRNTVNSVSGSTFWDLDSTWELTQNGGAVDVAVTASALRFVSNINLQAGVASATFTKTGPGEFRAGTGNFTTLSVNQGLYRIDQTAGTETGFGAVNGSVNIASGAAVGTSADIISPATRTFTLGAGAAGSTFVTNAAWTVNGTVGGAGGFVLNGNGFPTLAGTAGQTLTLAGTNTYAGPTRINLGTLAVSGGNAIPDGSAVTIVPNITQTVALLVNESETIGSLAGGGALSGALNVAAGTLTTGGDNTTTTFAGQITGAGNLVKVGTGTMTLTGAANGLTGTTTVKGGTLIAAAPGSLAGYNVPGRVSASSGTTLAVRAGGAAEWAASDIDTLRANTSFAAGSQLGIDTGTASFNYGSPISGAMGIKKLGGNTLTLSGVNNFTGGTTVAAGTLVAADADALGAPDGALEVADGAVARLQPSLAKAVSLSTISAHTTGTLDITNDSLVIRGMTVPEVQQLVAAGFSNGTWMGAGGITSSTASGSAINAIGFVSNAMLDKASFSGVSPLSASDVLVKYTYYGDADLSGTVTLDDFTLFLGGYRSGGSTWLQGDFNYDGAVTLDDFSLFLLGLRQQGAPLSQLNGALATGSDKRTIMAAMIQAAPEPSALALLLPLACIAMRRTSRIPRFDA